MKKTLIKNAQIVNENVVFNGDLLIENNIIKEKMVRSLLQNLKRVGLRLNAP